MFGLFKSDPAKKLNKKYQQLLKEARDIQRSGDIKLYAEKIAEADEVAKELDKLNAK